MGGGEGEKPIYIIISGNLCRDISKEIFAEIYLL